MNQYRKDIDKIYQKILKIVGKGKSYTQNYYDLIDEVISFGQYELLQDVLATKFKIDLRTYATIDDFKKTSFKKLSSYTESKSNQNLESLYVSKSVYTLGTQFFDVITSQYLGDIKQYNTSTISQALEIYTFFPQYMKDGIPSFINSPLKTVNYKTDNIVYYGEKLYQCSQNYTWNKDNKITPTFSNYWYEVYPGTQSLQNIENVSLSIYDKYSYSIDILRNYYYISYSNNNYLVSNYIDEYFE